MLRGDTQVAVIGDAGAVFGEMSVLLNRPHTATVKAKSPVVVFVFDDAESFLKSNPENCVSARPAARRAPQRGDYLTSST